MNEKESNIIEAIRCISTLRDDIENNMSHLNYDKKYLKILSDSLDKLGETVFVLESHLKRLRTETSSLHRAEMLKIEELVNTLPNLLKSLKNTIWEDE